MKGSKNLPVVSRRAFVATLTSFSGIAALGCSKKRPEFACTDVSALTDVDRTARSTMLYVDRAQNPEKECLRCVQYVEADEGCGTCRIVRGPIHPRGTCKSFAAKT